jgi:hypothetical protein
MWWQNHYYRKARRKQFITIRPLRSWIGLGTAEQTTHSIKMLGEVTAPKLAYCLVLAAWCELVEVFRYVDESRVKHRSTRVNKDRDALTKKH